MKRFFRSLLIVLLVLFAFAAGRLYPVLRRPPLIPRQDAVVTGVNPAQVPVSYNPDLGGFIDIGPRDFGKLLIFYPGGLVRPQAYTWLGVALAPLGVRTLIPVFPVDLAVTAVNRADRLLPLAGRKPVILGGHSLGGAMAARYVLRHPNAATGLVLLGAYSPEGDNLSGLPLDVLVLAAENDGLASLAEVRAGLGRLPDSAQFTVIKGSVHSFFGRYGPQTGDGLPSVTRAAAEAQITRALRAFFR